MVTTETIHKPQNRTFEADVEDVIRDLRGSLGSTIGLLPGASRIRKPSDLQRELGIDAKLAWQIHRLAFEPRAAQDPIGLPRSASVKRFLRAAGKCGVAKGALDQVHRALDGLDQIIALHAGDVTTFDSMLAGISEGGSEQVDLANRRTAFRALSHLWGVQVKTSLTCTFLHPGSTSEMVDAASIRGMIEIRRLRYGVPFQLSGHRIRDVNQALSKQHAVDGLNAAEAEQSIAGACLLTEFCTKPLPELEHRVDANNYTCTYLRDTPLGNIGAQSLYLADSTRNIRWRNDPPHQDEQTISVRARKPTEVLVLDILIQRGMFGTLEPEARVFGTLDDPPQGDPRRVLPDDAPLGRAEVHNIGVGLTSLATPFVPRYQEMVETVCTKLGWNPNSFEAFRCVIEYPLLNSIVGVRFPLPTQGNW